MDARMLKLVTITVLENRVEVILRAIGHDDKYDFMCLLPEVLSESALWNNLSASDQARILFHQKVWCNRSIKKNEVDGT